MKGFNKFFSSSKKKLKISGNKDWDRRILNSNFGEKEFFLIHPDTLDAMEKGNPIYENRHFNISPIMSDKEFQEKVIECTYTDDCPVCLASENRAQFRSEIYDYIEDVLGIKDKKTDTPFYQTYKESFLDITTNAIMIKVLYFSPSSFSGMDKPKTRLIRLTTGLLKKFEELYASNEELFDSAEIITRPIQLVTNGKQGKNIRYEEMSVIPKENITPQLNMLIPDWSKVDIVHNFDNFDVSKCRPATDVATSNSILGNVKMYDNAQDLIDDIESLMASKKKDSSVASSPKSKLSKFKPAELVESPVDDGQFSDMLEEAASDLEDKELLDLEQSVADNKEQDEGMVLIKYSELSKPDSLEHCVQILQKFLDYADTIVAPKKPGKTLVNKISKGINTDPKIARMELVKFAAEHDILIDDMPF